MPEIDDDLLTLLDEDGQEHSFIVLEILDVDGQSYAILAPAEDADDDDEGEAYIFRIETEDGDDRLVTVEDEEEFDRVAAALSELEDWEESEEDDEDGS